MRYTARLRPAATRARACLLTLAILLMALPAPGGAAQAREPTGPQGETRDGERADTGGPVNAPARETDLGGLLGRAREAYREEDYEAMREALARAVALRPHLADLRFALARADALLDRKTEAYNSLVLLDKQGLSFDMTGDPDFENLRGFELYDFLQQQFAQNAEPYGAATRAFTIDRRDLLLESLAWDPARERLLTGSVTTGRIFSVGDDGALAPFVTPTDENALLGITALAVDPDRDALWVASGATPQFEPLEPGQRGLTQLHRFDLGTGEQTARFPAPARPMLFIDLALGPDGTVYAVDAVKPVVWQIPARGAEAGQLVPFFMGRGLTSVRSIALDAAGEHLYLADYERGLFGMDLAERKLFPVHLGDALNLGGIDAIHWHQDSLIVLQNGVRPRRVLRLQLFDDRRRARHVQALESAHPAFRNPVAGAITGPDRFLLIANSHRGAYDPRTGEPIGGAPREPHTVLAIDPGFNWRPPERP